MSKKTVAVICNNSVKCKYSFNVEKTVLFQTIQLRTSAQFKCKYGLIVKTFLFQAIQFTQTIQFNISMPLVLFNP